MVRIGEIAGGLSPGEAGEFIDRGDDLRQDDQNLSGAIVQGYASIGKTPAQESYAVVDSGFRDGGGKQLRRGNDADDRMRFRCPCIVSVLHAETCECHAESQAD